MWRLILILLLGCQNPSYESFRENGKSKTRSLIAELKSIRSKDQLIEKKDKVIYHFKELASLAHSAQEYDNESIEDKLPPLTSLDLELSDLLRIEILRIYRLEGGKEIIDACRDF